MGRSPCSMSRNGNGNARPGSRRSGPTRSWWAVPRARLGEGVRAVVVAVAIRRSPEQLHF